MFYYVNPYKYDPNKYVHNTIYYIFYIEVYIYLYKGNITLYI